MKIGGRGEASLKKVSAAHQAYILPKEVSGML